MRRVGWRDYNLRQRHIERCGFPIITLEVLDALVKFIGNRPVVEVGSGTGYLARHLQKRGVNITAMDSRTGECTRESWWDGRKLYFPATIVDVTTIESFKPAEIVVMSWPCYDTDFAKQVAEKMDVGQILIYQGEGRGGCTGDREFFDVLEQHFIPFKGMDELDDQHVQFFGIHDRWRVYKKFRPTPTHIESKE